MSAARETAPQSADAGRDRGGVAPVDGAILGYRCPRQIDSILPAAKLVLSDEDLEQINRGAK